MGRFFVIAAILVTVTQPDQTTSAMEADVKRLVARAEKLERLWPWQAPIAEIDPVVRHGKAVAPLLVRLLDDDPDSGAAGIRDWRVQQQAALALCRLYGVTEECGHVYCNRTTRDVNRRVKTFWVSKTLEAHEQVARTVKGLYRLPAKGFAVAVPRDAMGLLEDDPVVERGIRIALSSGGSVFVYAEMNALEWRTPAEGLRWTVSHRSIRDNCTASPVSDAKVGPLVGAGSRLLCGEEVVTYALAFRPGGGPIYWLRLETNLRQEATETKAFDRIAASFRLIRWE